MADFSVTTVATEGFRIIKKHPGAVAVWAALNIALMILLGVAFVLILGLEFVSSLGTLGQQIDSGAIDTPEVLALFGKVVLLLLVFGPITLVASAMMYAAVNRIVLRPQEKSPGFLRLGMDEVRILGLQIVIFVMYCVLVMAAGGLIFAAARLNGWLAFLVGLATICAVFFVLVRLSLCVPQTFATRKFNLFGSWALTKQRFWPLFGTYALTLTFYLVIVIVVGVVMAVLSLIVTFATLGSDGATGSGAVLGAAGVVQILQLLVQSVLSALVLAIFYGPPAAVYQALTGAGETDVDVFT